MTGLLNVRPDDLGGDLAADVYRLLRDAFPDDGPSEGDYYRTLGAPEVAMLMNETRFIESNGAPRTLVYRGSMYAELSHRRWPNQLLDLRGRTV